MNKFEIFNKDSSGKKKFKAVLAEIHPDNCVVNKTGTLYNDNGCTWIKQYVEKNQKSIVGNSVTVEFIDDERIEICGHGLTDVKDNVPIFNTATMIGFFTDAYVAEVEIDGETKTVYIGEGELDYFRYRPFIDNLIERLNDGETIYGSVELVGTKENDNQIIYLDGYKDVGRIPVDFEFSGWAILDIQPSDSTSRIIEINQKNKEETKLNAEEIMEIVKGSILEANNKNVEFENKIVELNEIITARETDLETANAKIVELETELETIKAEKAISVDENTALKKTVAEMKVVEKLAEVDNAIKDFTEDELAEVKDDITTLKETISATDNPENLNNVTNEINNIKSKICVAIVSKMKSNMDKGANVEIHSKENTDDICSDIDDVNLNNSTEYKSIIESIF